MENEIEINGIKYVKKDDLAKNEEGLEYVVVRGDRSGVFAGYLFIRESREVTLLNCRRLWYWDGAASVSDIARKGLSKPENCKFTAPIAKILILDTIEILNCTEDAKKSIEGVAIWTK
jgi:hypothetical protein